MREAFVSTHRKPKRTNPVLWRVKNAFTSAFKKLDPVAKFKATAKLGEFLGQLPAFLRSRSRL